MFSSLTNLLGLSDHRASNRKDGHPPDAKNPHRSPVAPTTTSSQVGSAHNSNSNTRPYADIGDSPQSHGSSTSLHVPSSRAAVSHSYIHPSGTTTMSPSNARNGRAYSTANIEDELRGDDGSKHGSFTRMKLSALTGYHPASDEDEQDASVDADASLAEFESFSSPSNPPLPTLRNSAGGRSRAGSMVLPAATPASAAVYRDDDADALFYTEDFTIANAHLLPDPVFDVGDTVARVATAARLCVYPEVTEHVREEASGWQGGAGVKGIPSSPDADADTTKDAKSPAVAAYEVDVAGASAALASLLIAAGGDVGLLRAAGEALIARSQAIDSEGRMARMGNLGLGAGLSPHMSSPSQHPPPAAGRARALSCATTVNGALLPLSASSRNPFTTPPATASAPAGRVSEPPSTRTGDLAASVSSAAYTCGICAARFVVDAVRPPALTLTVDKPGPACAVFLPAQGDCVEYVKEAVKAHGLKRTLNAPAACESPAALLPRLGCGDTEVALALPGASDRGLGITMDLLGAPDARDTRRAPEEEKEEPPLQSPGSVVSESPASSTDGGSVDSENKPRKPRPTPTDPDAHNGRGPGGAYLPSAEAIPIRVDVTSALTHGARMVKVGFGRTYHTHVKVSDDLRYLVWEVPGPEADLQADSPSAVAPAPTPAFGSTDSPRQRLADMQRANTYTVATSSHVNSYGQTLSANQYYSSFSFTHNMPPPIITMEASASSRAHNNTSNAAGRVSSVRARSGSSASQTSVRLVFGQPLAAPLPFVPATADVPRPATTASLADLTEGEEGKLSVSSAASWSALMASQRIYADLSQPRTHRVYALMYDVRLPRDLIAHTIPVQQSSAQPEDEIDADGAVVLASPASTSTAPSTHASPLSSSPSPATASDSALTVRPELYSGFAHEDTLRQSNVPRNCRAIPIESIVAIQAGVHTSKLRAQNNSLPACFAISIFYEFPARVPPADSMSEYEANAAAGAIEMVNGQPRVPLVRKCLDIVATDGNEFQLWLRGLTLLRNRYQAAPASVVATTSRTLDLMLPLEAKWPSILYLQDMESRTLIEETFARHKLLNSQHAVTGPDILPPVALKPSLNVRLHGTMSSIAHPALLECLISQAGKRASLCKWQRAYSLLLDGADIDLMWKKIGRYPHTLVLLRDQRGRIMGGYNSTQWSVGTGYQGNTEAFIFNVTALPLPPHLTDGRDHMTKAEVPLGGRAPEYGAAHVYPWRGHINYYTLSDSQGFGWGGGGGMGLYVYNNLRTAKSEWCGSFQNPPLSDTTKFNIYELEVWGGAMF